MSHTIAEIAAAIGAEAVGDTAIAVAGAAEPGEAGADHLALAMDEKYAGALGQGAARAAVLWPGADWHGMGLDAAIFVERPRLAMAGLTKEFEPAIHAPEGVHPAAVVEDGAELGAGVSVGPFVHIGPGAKIGAGSRILAGASIGQDAVIGEGALIHSGARIGARVTAGARLIVQPNAVIGGDGFSYVTPEPDAVEQVRKTLGAAVSARQSSYARIASLGSVRLGENVEVGANATIDRGTISDTVIGDGTKVDNLVMVGHNCRIGRDTLLCGLVGLAGSVEIGDRVVLAGKVGVADHVTIGDDVIAGGGSIILSKVPAGRVLLGYPATKMDQNIEAYKALRRLPRLARQVAELEKRVSKAPESD